MEPDGETMDGGSSAVTLKNREQGHEVRPKSFQRVSGSLCVPVWMSMHVFLFACPCLYVPVCICPCVCPLVCVDRRWWGACRRSW